MHVFIFNNFLGSPTGAIPETFMLAHLYSLRRNFRYVALIFRTFHLGLFELKASPRRIFILDIIHILWAGIYKNLAFLGVKNVNKEKSNC
jgi:hypothetical protein